MYTFFSALLKVDISRIRFEATSRMKATVSESECPGSARYENKIADFAFALNPIYVS